MAAIHCTRVIVLILYTQLGINSPLKSVCIGKTGDRVKLKHVDSLTEIEPFTEIMK